MPASTSHDYYIRRSAQAREMADLARTPEARLAHREMAAIYDRLASSALALTAPPLQMPAARTSVDNSQ